MHPAAIITGLRRELERLDPSADDYADRKAQIEREIRHADGQPRPEVKADDQNTIVDHNIGYLEGLKRELARTARERSDEIKAEIERVEKLIHDRRNTELAAVSAEQEQSGGPAERDDGDGAEDNEAGAIDEPEGDDYFSADFEASKSRVELDEIAISLGVPDPDKLQNKGAVIDAIRAVSAEQEQ